MPRARIDFPDNFPSPSGIAKVSKGPETVKKEGKRLREAHLQAFNLFRRLVSAIISNGDEYKKPPGG
ncbi:MAG TPA: hypothetical protein VMW29_03125 [Candidatus Bathyarchaeia archaeon]|nr:hypothetical protein [Candidatus Bathyarchaeia archaeon]